MQNLKWLLLLLIIPVLVILWLLGKLDRVDTKKSNFKKLYSAGSITYYRDIMTDNIWIKWKFLSTGSFLPYYNKDGSIMKYEEFKILYKEYIKDMKNVFEKLNEIYELDEANNNFASDKAKKALMKKYVDVYERPIVKSECVLHHLNGDHNDDIELKNDLLIVADDKKDAVAAHKIIHLLSYCALEDELKAKLKSLNVELFYKPDGSPRPVELSIDEICYRLANHDRNLHNISIADQEEEDSLDAGTAGTDATTPDIDDKAVELNKAADNW